MNTSGFLSPLNTVRPKKIDTIQMAMFSIDPKDDIKSMIYEGNTLKLIPGEDFDLNWLASLPKEQNSRSISFIGKTHSGKENFQTLILVNLIFLISDSISKKKVKVP